MKILLVSGEYPPLNGGVGRYSYNLAIALRSKKLDVQVAAGRYVDVTKSSPPINDHNFSNHIRVHYNVIAKGDRKNSDRLLDLIERIKPDVVNLQYERGLYEIDTTISQIFKRALYGSTLDDFYTNSPVPIVTTLHTIVPYNEYQEYIKERALRKEGRFARLPLFLRASIRRWVLKQRYHLLLDVVKLSDEIICPARTTREVTNRGVLIYHGAEPIFSVRRENKCHCRNHFGLPCNKKLLLAFGYVGSYKGFEILDKLSLPSDWELVVKQNKHERGSEQPVKVNGAVNLHLVHISDEDLSRLFFSCDAIIFPYRIVSVSGVLFDALAHGLPFVASDLRFFREFSKMGLGITSERSAESFSKALFALSEDYDKYRKNVLEFSPVLRWSVIADNHIDVYSRLSSKRI